MRLTLLSSAVVAMATLSSACTPPEAAFVSKADLDKAHTLADVRTMCVGLKMKDDDTREYAASKLKDYKDDGAKCLCDHLTRDGTWDPAVFNGLARAKDDARVGCVATAFDDTSIKDRAGMATAMMKIEAPSVHARLVLAANSDSDPDVQAAALPALRGTTDPKELEMLITGLKRGGVWGANAAYDLTGLAPATDALRDILKTGDAQTKSAALLAYRAAKTEDWGEVACAALNDADAAVRLGALTAVASTRNAQILGCMRDHLMAPEPDAAVRLALLQTLSTDAAPEAAKALCDAIPYWVKTYITDTAPQPKSVEDIVYYQNDRDFENSLACADKAFKGSGYTVCGKAYLGARVNEFGGKARYKDCPAAAPAASGDGTVQF